MVSVANTSMCRGRSCDRSVGNGRRTGGSTCGADVIEDLRCKSPARTSRRPLVWRGRTILREVLGGQNVFVCTLAALVRDMAALEGLATFETVEFRVHPAGARGGPSTPALYGGTDSVECGEG